MSDKGASEVGLGRLRVNSRDVVHEQVDGEVIAIDLGRGSYYSLAGGAADAWSMLEAGATAEEIAGSFRGSEDRAALDSEIAALLEQLSTEMLVLPAEGNGADPSLASFDYRPFTFEKYEDLQDYFLLDPIHEVGEAGWPAPKPS